VRARAVVIALLVVVGTGGVALLEWDLVRERAARLRRTGQEASFQSGPTASSADAGAANSASDRASNARRSQVDEAKADGDVTEETPRIPVDGIVIVTDSAGVEQTSETGTFYPYFYEVVANPDPRRDPPCDRGERVTLEHGRFHVDVPAGRRFGAGDLVIGGRGAFVDSAPIDTRPGDVVSIRAHWPRGVRLHVVDATTNAELDQVDVVRRDFDLSSEWSPHPGTPPRGTVVVHHGVSPVVLDPALVPLDLEVRGLPWNQSVEETLLVRARGHAWATVEIDFESSAERTVELETAAQIVVDIQGALPPSPRDVSGPPRGAGVPFETAMLRVRKYERPLSFDELVAQRIAQIEAIPASDLPDVDRPTRDEIRQELERARAEIEA